MHATCCCVWDFLLPSEGDAPCTSTHPVCIATTQSLRLQHLHTRAARDDLSLAGSETTEDVQALAALEMLCRMAEVGVPSSKRHKQLIPPPVLDPRSVPQ